MSYIHFFALFLLVSGLICLVLGKIIDLRGNFRGSDKLMFLAFVLFLLGLFILLINSLFNGFLREFLAKINFSKVLLGLALFLIIAGLLNIEGRLKEIKEELSLLNQLLSKSQHRENKNNNLSPYSQDKIKDKADTSSWL